MEPATPDLPPPKCPECGSKLAKALETRHIEFRGVRLIVRVKRCRHCGFNYRTQSPETQETMAQDDVVLSDTKKRLPPKKIEKPIKPDPLPPIEEPGGNDIFPPV